MKLLVSSRQKLVPFLQGPIEGCSGKTIRRLLEANLCRVNGRIERFGSRHLQRGDVVELDASWKEMIEGKNPKPQFTTLYENEEMLLVNKPIGWVCSEENCRRTFNSSLQLVHRLDKDTSGVLILAKSLKAREALMELFAKREVEKKYLALVDGVPKEQSGCRESYLRKKGSFAGQTIWGSGQSGLHAVTHWNLLQKGKDAALLSCQPVTGRTHQIRVHLAEMGHPILIDRQYAATYRSSYFARRPLLHAHRLKIEHVEVIAPVPSDMQETLNAIIGHHPR